MNLVSVQLVQVVALLLGLDLSLLALGLLTVGFAWSLFAS